MGSTRTIRLTLDNLSYKCIINNNQEIKIILPCSMLPERTQVFESINKQGKKECSVIVKAVNPVKLSLFFVNKTDTSPTVNLLCDNKNTKIDGNVKLQPKSKQMYEFISVDGGLNWLVNSLKEDSGIVGETTIVNGKSGPNIIIDAGDIKLKSPIQGENGTIQEQLESIANKVTIIQESIDTGLSADVMKTIAKNKDQIEIVAPKI